MAAITVLLLLLLLLLLLHINPEGQKQKSKNYQWRPSLASWQLYMGNDWRKQWDFTKSNSFYRSV